MFIKPEGTWSIHQTLQPVAETLTSEDIQALKDGEYAIAAISAIRQGKSKNKIAFKAVAEQLIVGSTEEGLKALAGFDKVLKNFTSSVNDVKFVKIEDMDSDSWNSPNGNVKVKLIFKE